MAWPSKARARNGACRLKPPALGILSLHSATTQFHHSHCAHPTVAPQITPKASPFAQTPTFMGSFGAEKTGESTGIVHTVQNYLSYNLDCQYLSRSSTGILSTPTRPPECPSLYLPAPQCVQANHVKLLVEYCKLRAQLWSSLIRLVVQMLYDIYTLLPLPLLRCQVDYHKTNPASHHSNRRVRAYQHKWHKLVLSAENNAV